MKTWRCPFCKHIRETKNNVAIVICNHCLTDMKVESQTPDYKTLVEIN
jgi:ribosomal protein L37AE/L43A